MKYSEIYRLVSSYGWRCGYLKRIGLMYVLKLYPPDYKCISDVFYKVYAYSLETLYASVLDLLDEV